MNLVAFNNTNEEIKVVTTLPDGPFGNIRYDIEPKTGQISILWDDDENDQANKFVVYDYFLSLDNNLDAFYKIRDKTPEQWTEYLGRDLDTMEINYSNFKRIGDYFVFYGSNQKGTKDQLVVLKDEQLIGTIETPQKIQRVWLSYED